MVILEPRISTVKIFHVFRTHQGLRVRFHDERFRDCRLETRHQYGKSRVSLLSRLLILNFGMKDVPVPLKVEVVAVKSEIYVMTSLHLCRSRLILGAFER